MSNSELVFFVNGHQIVEKAPDPEWTLLYYLREKLRLCGTKLGCGEGGCGACTVMVSMYEHESQKINHMSVNACLAPVCAMHGLAVTTVEGIGSVKKKLHTVQERMAKMHASQCGFCTPGMVMSMYALLRNKPKPQMEDLEEYLKGNLCRCTGYRPILESMKTLCDDNEMKGTGKVGANAIRGFADMDSSNEKQAGTGISVNDSIANQSKDRELIEEAVAAAKENGSEMVNGRIEIKDEDAGCVRKGKKCCSAVELKKGCCKAGKTCCRDPSVTNGSTKEVNGLNSGNATKENGEMCVGASKKCCNQSVTTNGLNNVQNSNSPKFAPYDPSQEPIFPPSLLNSSKVDAESLVFRGERVTWYRPASLDDLLLLKSRYSDAKIVVGNTEVGLERKFKQMEYPLIIHPSHVKELKQVSYGEYGVKFGASVTLDKMESVCRKVTKTVPEYQSRIFSAIIEMLQWFAGKQIRNVGSIGGNIMTGSPISDLNPIFMTSKCKLEVVSVDSRRVLQMDENFYVGYRRTCFKPEEVLISITVPYTEESEYFEAYKQAKRRDDDIAIVNLAARMLLKNGMIQDVSLCYGGLAPTTKLALQTMQKLRGIPLGQEALVLALRSICEEFDLPSNAPGGMVQYRRSLALSLFFKFFVHVTEKIGIKLLDIPRPCGSATEKFHKRVIKSHQFCKIPESGTGRREVGKPMPHKSAELHTTGEAVYTDDMPRTTEELDLAFVISNKAHAKLISIDASEALSIEGVVDFVSDKDLTPERNRIGIPGLSQDEEVYASETVNCVGQVIGAVVAKNRDIAKKAARKVKILYEELPAIITMEEAIKENSFFDAHVELSIGNVTEAFENCDHIIEGTIKTGAQEHFYLEPQTCVAFPLNENDEMIIYASTQAPTDTQAMVAHVLGIDHNRVVCHVKRIGGGFGGKESRSSCLAVAVAAAAQKVGKPVRMVLDRDEDMIMTGYRHPFLAKYKVGFNNDGRIKAVDTDLYANAGWSEDLSVLVIRQSILACNNSYHIPNFRSAGDCCKTNLPSNTAFRGFGKKQGMMVAESWVHDVATILNKDPAEVREINMYKGGEMTHFNQKMDPGVRKCWDKCLEDSEYYKKKQEIMEFNKTHRWKKKGIAAVPVSFGIGFEPAFLNQGAALLNVYLDGSVLLSHGGVEMGQGLHTKMIQVASTALQLPPEKIFVSHAATDKVPNSIVTAGSLASDLYGMAVLDACEKLMARLEPFKKPGTKWEDWVVSAFFDRVSLSATGFYKTPDAGYNIQDNTGRCFNYFTFGAACSVVEIDCLTGDHKVLRTDIVMDLGESLNPAIDIGQIEGGFMQGYGLFVLEQMQHKPTGELLSFGPSTYKIPSVGDVPEEFNVSLLSGSPNVRAVYSSKAVGEPPLFLAASVFFAIKDAVGYARKEAGREGIFKLEIPATAERIRMACEDVFTDMVSVEKEALAESCEPWFIQV